MKKLLTYASVITFAAIIMAGCNGTPEYTDNSILLNIDSNIASQVKAINALNSKLDDLNILLANIDRNLITNTNNTAAIANMLDKRESSTGGNR